jgi:hypothetical protein
MQGTWFGRILDSRVVPRWLAVAALLAACGDKSPTAPDIRTLVYAPSLEVDISTFVVAAQPAAPYHTNV